MPFALSPHQWNAKDASEKEKRVALKQEKARLADQAKDFVHELDEIDKQVSSLPLSPFFRSALKS